MWLGRSGLVGQFDGDGRVVPDQDVLAADAGVMDPQGMEVLHCRDDLER